MKYVTENLAGLELVPIILGLYVSRLGGFGLSGPTQFQLKGGGDLRETLARHYTMYAALKQVHYHSCIRKREVTFRRVFHRNSNAL